MYNPKSFSSRYLSLIQSDLNPEKNIQTLIFRNLKLARASTIKFACAICGELETEMHHIHHVRKTLKTKKKKSLYYFLEAMRLVNRKTIPLCKKHHRDVHNGIYDGIALSKVFKYFEKNKAGFNKKEAQVLIASCKKSNKI